MLEKSTGPDEVRPPYLIVTAFATNEVVLEKSTGPDEVRPPYLIVIVFAVIVLLTTKALLIVAVFVVNVFDPVVLAERLYCRIKSLVRIRHELNVSDKATLANFVINHQIP